MSERARPVMVFDLGGVLIDWDPRHLYRQLFSDHGAMETFLGEVCTPEWNEAQDAGRTMAEATAEAIGRHPGERAMIEAYYDRWGEMMAGPIEGTVAILEALRKAGFELHALTNWSAETFPIARERFGFLDHFQTILVSGEVSLKKPDARIFSLLLDRIGHPAEACIYIDDSAKNITAATTLGFDAIHFQDPSRLRDELLQRRITTATT